MKRREFLEMASIAAASAAVAGATRTPSFRGRVTGAGKPLAGVVVSDGLNCTVTNADGHFEIFPPRFGARFVQLSVPSGWAIADHFLPVQEGKASYDFDLQPFARSAEGAKLSFVHLADSEISNHEDPLEKRFAEHVRKVAAEDGCAFVVHTGDICYARGLRAHRKLINFERTGVPCFYCVGNHDLVKEGPYGEWLFETIYGPAYYSFNAGGVHFVVTPMARGDRAPSYNHAQIAAWLQRDLAMLKPGTPTVVFNHGLEGRGVNPFEIADKCKLTGHVFGHWHYNHFRRYGETAVICTGTPQKGGIDQSPASVRVVEIDAKGRLTSHTHYGDRNPWKLQRAGAKWEADVGAPVYLGTPVLDGGRLFVGTLDDDGLGTGSVTALNAETGKQLWRQAMPASVKNRLIGINGMVVAQDTDGCVRAFDMASGARKWEYNLQLPPVPVLDKGLGVDRARGIVFAGEGETLTAIKAATGEVVWRGAGWRMAEGCADRVVCAEGLLIGGRHWGALYCNDAVTGKLKWGHTGMPFRFRAGEVLIENGKVFLGSYRSFLELEAATGKVLREKQGAFSYLVSSAPVRAGGKFLIGTAGHGLVALDEKTLECVWQGKTGNALAVSSSYTRPEQMTVATVPVVCADKVIVAASDGCIHIFALADGKELARYDTGAPYFNAPVVAGNQMWSADFAGRVRCFQK